MLQPPKFAIQNFAPFVAYFKRLMLQGALVRSQPRPQSVASSFPQTLALLERHAHRIYPCGSNAMENRGTAFVVDCIVPSTSNVDIMLESLTGRFALEYQEQVHRF